MQFSYLEIASQQAILISILIKAYQRLLANPDKKL
jgi:hypothetical protein